MSIVYISGPITGHEDTYMEAFNAAEMHLKSRGYEVINPAATMANLPASVAYAGYLKVSLALLELADRIYMLEGWEKSKGAMLEYAYARVMGMKILWEKCEAQNGRE